MRSFYCKAGVFAVVSLFSTTAAAGFNGGLLVFAPESIAVPVFSGPMLIGLSLLFSVIAFRVLKNGGGANRVASVSVLAAGALVTSLVGVDQVRSSGIYTPAPGECSTGGEIHFSSSDYFRFDNNCANDLRVVRLERACDDVKDSPINDRDVDYPECAEGVIVASQSSCEVESCPPD